MKIKDIVREENRMYKVIKNDPTAGIDLQHPDDPHSTLHLDPEAAKAIAANPDNPNQFTMNPAIAGVMGADAPQGPQGPQQGAEVEMPATEDYELDRDMMQKGRRNRGIGGDDTDNYIDDVTDHDFEQNAHEDFLGFGNKSPEEWAKTSKQMAELLKLQKAYQGTQYQSQIEKRIKILKDRLDMDAGEVGGPGGIPKPVVPPEKFKQFDEDDEVSATPQLSPEDQQKLEPYKNIDPADGSAYYDYPPTDPKETGARMGTMIKSPAAVEMSKQTQPKIIADLLDMIDSAPATSDMKGSMDTSEPGATGPSTDNYMVKDLEEHGDNPGSRAGSAAIGTTIPGDEMNWLIINAGNLAGQSITKGKDGVWRSQKGATATDPAVIKKIEEIAKQSPEYRKQILANQNNFSVSIVREAQSGREARPTGKATMRGLYASAPVQESADDKLLQQMLSIAGLR